MSFRNLVASVATLLFSVAATARDDYRAGPNITCSISSTFARPHLKGIHVLNVSASAVYNFVYEQATGENITIDYCEVNTTYTHEGYHDTVVVTAYLPLDGWNGRFLGSGGGGYIAGSLIPNGPVLLNGPSGLAKGWVVASTDGGHALDGLDPSTWALDSLGNVNYNALSDFSFKALDELPQIGKQIAHAFYGKNTTFSYWQGCSTGGRQGLMSAQRFPNNYDGILAGCPAIYWPQWLVASQFMQVVMKELAYWPPQCELSAIRNATIAACDRLDGVVDGVISRPTACHFDPHTLVGTFFDCEGVTRKVTRQAATVVSKFRHGPNYWFGYNPDADFYYLGNTTMVNGTLGPNPFELTTSWIQYFLAKDPSFDWASLDESGLAHLFSQSVREYDSIIGTSDPDLSLFKVSGAKMIHYHGQADDLIPPNGSAHYYEAVESLDPSVRDYYRFFVVPGSSHCTAGPGYYPTHAMESLVAWVEHGIEPDTLEGTNSQNGNTQPLCQYPLMARWDGVQNPNKSSSYHCRR